MKTKLCVSMFVIIFIGLLFVFVTPALANGSNEPPHKYKLHSGEFPWCIARRFNVNPYELLRLNGLRAGQIYRAGLVLKIPQSGNPFPGERALHPHPDTYIVQRGDTLYSVACYYGDVEPMAIAQANNLESPYKLNAGQALQIPGEEEITGDVLQPTPTETTSPTPLPPAETVSPTPLPPAETASPTATPSVEVPEPSPTATPTLKATPSPGVTSTPPTATPTPTPSPKPPTVTVSKLKVTPTPTLPAAFSEDRRAKYVDTLKTVTLNPATVNIAEGQVPMGEELVAFGIGGGGGGGCVDEKEARVLVTEEAEQNWDVSVIACRWLEGDSPKAYIFYPDGRQVELVAQDEGEFDPEMGLMFYFPSLITDPPGEYQVMVQGQKSGSSANEIFNLTQPDAPRAMRIGSDTVYLYAFTPGEIVTVEVYTPDQDYNPVFLGSVEFMVDETGQLKIALEWIEGTYDDDGYQLIITGEKSNTPAVVYVSGGE